MNERTRPDSDAPSAQVGLPVPGNVSYRTVTEPHASPYVGHVQRRYNHVVAARHSTMASEHSQLVETIHTTDGVSREQAELQVTAFEKYFRDDPL